MSEFKKKWFQIVWMVLLAAHLIVSSIQRKSDALWAQSEGIKMLDTVLMWIILPLTVLLFILHNIETWRKGERYFWRQCQKTAWACGVGGGLGFLVVIIVMHYKGDAVEIDNVGRIAILAVFAAIALLYFFARYKYKHWRGEE